MPIPLIYKDDVIKNPSIKETKERVKNQKYKTYSLKHSLMESKYPGVILDKFFWDYNETLNNIIQDIWDTIEWKEWDIDKNSESQYYRYNQKRLYPNYRKDNEFKKDIRDHYLKNWKYSTHWIDSAISTAFSILDSWKKNYNKGKRKRKCPVAKRRFVRVKQTLMKIEKVNGKDGIERDRLRISIKPRMFIYINLSKRYFKINGRIGEPILTPTHIHLPIEDDKNSNSNNTDEEIRQYKIGWDLNKFSMDGFCPELGWIIIDLKDLYTKHVAYDNKRRRINRLASKKKVVGKKLKSKYSKREKNVCSQIIHNKTNITKKLGIKHGFEDLNKYGMFKKKKGRRCRKWNRWINYTNWKQITDQMEYKSDIELVDPYHTSKDCSRCGCTNKDLKGERFECINKNCGLVIDRQAGGAINIYLRMEGLSQNIEWFDTHVLSRFTQTEAECSTTEATDPGANQEQEPMEVAAARKDVNELVRRLYDLMKPQFYIPSKWKELKTTLNLLKINRMEPKECISPKYN